jgi:hypothetical protein
MMIEGSPCQVDGYAGTVKYGPDGDPYCIIWCPDCDREGCERCGAGWLAVVSLKDDNKEDRDEPA